MSALWRPIAEANNWQPGSDGNYTHERGRVGCSYFAVNVTMIQIWKPANHNQGPWRRM